MPDPYPPEYDEEPPEDGVAEYQIGLGVCYSCEVVIGPDHAEDVGQDLHLNHEGHITEVLGVWRQVEVFDEERLFSYYKERNLKECLACHRVFPISDLGVEDNPIGTCPACGEHRFKSPDS